MFGSDHEGPECYAAVFLLNLTGCHSSFGQRNTWNDLTGGVVEMCCKVCTQPPFRGFKIVPRGRIPALKQY